MKNLVEKYMPGKTETFKYVINDTVTNKNFPAERISRKELKSRVRIRTGFILDSSGNKYKYFAPLMDYYVYRKSN